MDRSRRAWPLQSEYGMRMRCLGPLLREVKQRPALPERVDRRAGFAQEARCGRKTMV